MGYNYRMREDSHKGGCWELSGVRGHEVEQGPSSQEEVGMEQRSRVACLEDGTLCPGDGAPGRLVGVRACTRTGLSQREGEGVSRTDDGRVDAWLGSKETS